MKNKYSFFFCCFLFLFSCQSSDNNKEQSFIDIDKLPKKLTLVGENVISTALYERDMAISQKGDELIYTLGNHKQSKRCLVGIKKQNDNWGAPFILNISGKYQDIEPFYHPDGTRLYFASNRPIYDDTTRNDYNIWYSNKIEGEWSEPISLDSIINTKGDEFYPSLSKNGNLYFTATRENGIGREDIFQSAFIDGEFQPPLPLPTEINSTAFEFNAYIAPNEELLVFSSFGRKDGFGGGDLYISQKDSTGVWSKAKNMGALINSDKLDFCPYIDWRTGVFYFTSERIPEDNQPLKSIDELKNLSNTITNGFGNIYKIELQQLDLVVSQVNGVE